MCSMFFDNRQKQAQNLKQLQRLMMSPQMRQAIQLMQMPILEISQVIEGELQQNPILEYDEEEAEGEEKDKNEEDAAVEKELVFDGDDFEIMKRLDEDFRDHFNESENYYTRRTADEEKLKSFLEQSISVQESLFEHLMKQARETFETEKEIGFAEAIIGNFNENGYLQSSLMEISLQNNFDVNELKQALRTIQGFDPYGVGGRDLRECLLIQLNCRNEKDTLAYKIIKEHFDDLLHNRIPQIGKGLEVPIAKINEAIQSKIAHLDLHPGTTYSKKFVQLIVPDASISLEGEKLEIRINDDQLPIIRLNSRYLKMLDNKRLPKETKDFIRNKLMSAKWLIKNIDQRNETIFRILEAITKYQKEFFYQHDGKLVPLTMKTLAEELDLHESTIARAVSNKYVDTPRGTLPLRYFFSNAYTTAEGDNISSKTVRDVLERIIDGENKKKPLSDETISKMMERKGISCARRTVAKYRSELSIGNAKQRREF